MEITPALIKRVARDVVAMHTKMGAAIVLVGGRQPEQTMAVNISREPVWVPQAVIGQKAVTRLFWSVRHSRVLTDGKRSLAVWSVYDPDGEMAGGKKGGSHVGLALVLTEAQAKRVAARYPDTAFTVPVLWEVV